MVTIAVFIATGIVIGIISLLALAGILWLIGLCLPKDKPTYVEVDPYDRY